MYGVVRLQVSDLFWSKMQPGSLSSRLAKVKRHFDHFTLNGRMDYAQFHSYTFLWHCLDSDWGWQFMAIWVKVWQSMVKLKIELHRLHLLLEGSTSSWRCCWTCRMTHLYQRVGWSHLPWRLWRNSDYLKPNAAVPDAFCSAESSGNHIYIYTSRL